MAEPLSQLDLFADPEPEPEAGWVELARAIPPHVSFGTSSWTFEGWKGLVYHKRYASKKAFVQESLREYARFPLFRSVCVDRTYYGPLRSDEWEALAARVPSGFRFCTKVWSALTTRVIDGRPNPQFLDASVFLDAVLEPLERGLGAGVGPFVIQLAPASLRTNPDAFVRALERFVRDLPPHHRYAFELREPHLMTRRYLDLLRSHPGTSHLFNLHTRMPHIGAQVRRGGLIGDTAVVRLMIPPGEQYAERKAAYAPFDKLVKPNPRMRADVLRLVEATASRGMQLYVIANNKAEGSSPRTVIALAEALRAGARARSTSP